MLQLLAFAIKVFLLAKCCAKIFMYSILNKYAIKYSYILPQQIYYIITNKACTVNESVL